ncbi:hypothetical protein [Hymenobacter terricola]|uniref:hypothetical protein n=1 Tax=Hymenobacter terricola TaxID=2819236 RepID=UPI001B305571|nr:hypothetical protein [Hymenobacter terricola]
MRIRTFYSPLRGIGQEDVWHDNSECPIGNSIALTDRWSGKGSTGKRCQYCLLLDSRPVVAPLGCSPDPHRPRA